MRIIPQHIRNLVISPIFYDAVTLCQRNVFKSEGVVWTITSLRLAIHSSRLFFYPRQGATTNHGSNCSCLLPITQINYSPSLSSHRRYIFSNKPSISKFISNTSLPDFTEPVQRTKFRLRPCLCTLALALVRMLKTTNRARYFLQLEQIV